MTTFFTKTLGAVSAFALLASMVPSAVFAADGLAPAAPSFVSPANNSTLTDDELTTVNWTDVADATNYYLEAANTSDFASVIYSANTGTDSELAAPPTAPAEYYVRVRVTDDEAMTSDWSSTLHLTVVPPAMPGDNGLWYVDASNAGSEDGTEDHPFNTIEEAVAEADPGHTIMLASGSYTVSSTITINQADLTIDGAGDGSTVISGDISAGTYFFQVLAAGFTLKDVEIVKTDKAGAQALIYVGGSNFTLTDSTLHGQYVIGDGDVSRGFVFTGGLTGILIDDNTIYGLRQPGYLSGPTTGLISDNYVYGTKGWVLEGGDMTFTGNTWGTGANTNVYDIAILSAAPGTAYTNILAMSAANHDAVIEDQRTSPATLSAVYVDASTSYSSDLGGKYHPYATLASAVSRVTAGGTIHVAAGTYTGDVIINKALTLVGPNEGTDPTTDDRDAEATITGQINVYASDVTVDGFTITNPALNPGSPTTIKGVHVYSSGPVIGDIVLQNNIVTDINNLGAKGAYGIMVQGTTDGVTILANDIRNIISAGWAHALEVTPTGSNPVVPQNTTISGNVISSVSNASGTDQYGLSVDSSSSIFANAAEVSLEGNQFLNVMVRNLDPLNTLDASEHFWGTANPADMVVGDVLYAPWLSDEDGDSVSADVETETTITATSTNGIVVEVMINEETVITGEGWDGDLEEALEVTVIATSTLDSIEVDGYENIVPIIGIEIGSDDNSLLLSSAARIFFEGQGGKHVGWSEDTDGSDITEITNVCDADSQPVVDAQLGEGADCVITVGDDLIVWTKHFTTFAVYTATAVSTTVDDDDNDDSRSGSGGGNSSSSNDDDNSSDTGTVGGGQVLGASTYNFTVDLTIGSRGADVTELQTILIAAGYLKIPAPTGYFGAMTQAALKQWQAAHGVLATGYFGPLTRAALMSSATPAPAMSAAEREALLKKLADLLEQLKAAQAAQ